MIAAALLASPFLLDYDLVLLAIPLAWMARDSLGGGFLAWEKTVLVAAFILPAVSRSLANYACVPAAPVVVVALLALVVRRATRSAPRRAALDAGQRHGAHASAFSLAGEGR